MIQTGYIQKDHLPEHELGAVFPITNPGGHWLDSIPAKDVQQNIGVEPMCCTSEGNTAALETTLRKVFAFSAEYSARYLAKISGTTPQGNDPMTVQRVLESQGTVLEADWPNTADLKTWEAFYAEPPASFKIKALELPIQYAIKSQWIGADVQSIKAGLEVSPIGVAGYAWVQDQNGRYYTPDGAQPCHWFVIVDYIEDQTQPNGITWIAFDSYQNDVKTLRGDYVFAEAMQYQVTKNTGDTPAQQSSWTKFLQLMQKILDSFQRGLGLGDYHPDRLGGAARSPEWPKVRAAHLLKEPVCQLCGGKTKLNVHHIRPFHLRPELELDDTNLITLCTGSSSTINCHVRFGHWDNFRTKYNPHIVSEAAQWKARFDAIIEDENL